MNTHIEEPAVETVYEYEADGSAVRVQRVGDQLVIATERQTPAGLRQLAHWLSPAESERFVEALAADAVRQGIPQLLAVGYRQTAPEGVSLDP